MTEATIELTKQTPIAEPDLLFTVAQQIESLKDDKEAVYKQIGDVTNNKSFDDFKLGGLLAMAQDAKWFKADGYDNFKDFLAEVFPLIDYRKARYVIAMYLALVASEVEWDQVKDIGWTKLSRIAQVMDKDNAEGWINKARESTTVELLELIKIAKQTGDGEAPTPSEPIVKKNFALHEDQNEVVEDALSKAKAESDTEFDSVALDAICQNYLSGETVGPPQTLKQVMEEAGHMAVLEAFEVLWPSIDLHVSKKNESQ